MVLVLSAKLVLEQQKVVIVAFYIYQNYIGKIIGDICQCSYFNIFPQCYHVYFYLYISYYANLFSISLISLSFNMFNIQDHNVNSVHKPIYCINEEIIL